MKTFAELDIENNGQYIKLLSAVAKLSGLFSESATPLVYYRAVEIFFAKALKHRTCLVQIPPSMQDINRSA